MTNYELTASSKWGDWETESINKAFKKKNDTEIYDKHMKTTITYCRNSKGQVLKVTNKARVKVVERNRNTLEEERIKSLRLESGVNEEKNSCFTNQNPENIYIETPPVPKKMAKTNLFSKELTQVHIQI